MDMSTGVSQEHQQILDTASLLIKPTDSPQNQDLMKTCERNGLAEQRSMDAATTLVRMHLDERDLFDPAKRPFGPSYSNHNDRAIDIQDLEAAEALLILSHHGGDDIFKDYDYCDDITDIERAARPTHISYPDDDSGNAVYAIMAIFAKRNRNIGTAMSENWRGKQLRPPKDYMGSREQSANWDNISDNDAHCGESTDDECTGCYMDDGMAIINEEVARMDDSGDTTEEESSDREDDEWEDWRIRTSSGNTTGTLATATVSEAVGRLRTTSTPRTATVDGKLKGILVATPRKSKKAYRKPEVILPVSPTKRTKVGGKAIAGKLPTVPKNAKLNTKWKVTKPTPPPKNTKTTSKKKVNSTAIEEPAINIVRAVATVAVVAAATTEITRNVPANASTRKPTRLKAQSVKSTA